MPKTPQKLTVEDIRSLLDGQEDILSSCLESALPPPKNCPSCGALGICVVDQENPFTAGKLVQNFVLICPVCTSKIS